MKHQMWLKIYEEVGIATAFSVTETHCWCFHLFSASSKWQNRVWSHSDPNQCKQHQHEWLTNIWASNQLCLLVFPAVWIFYWFRIELHAEVIIHAHLQLRYPDVSNMCPPPIGTADPCQGSSFVPLKYYIFPLRRPCDRLPWQPSARDYSASSDKGKGMLT